MNPIGYNEIISDNVEKGIKSLITLLEQFLTVMESGDNIFKETLNTLKIEIDAVNKSMKDLNSTAQKKNDYTEKEVNELKQLASELEKLRSDYDTLKNAQKQYTEAQKQSKQATEETAGSIADLKKQLAELNKQKLNATEDQLKNIGAEASKVQGEIKRLENVFKSGAMAANNLAGSYDELSNRNRELKRELKSMAGGLDNTSEAAKRLKEQIAANDKVLKEFDSSIGENFRNVGNYASAFDGILGALSGSGGIIGGLAGLATGVGAVTVAIDLIVNGFTAMSEAVEKTNKNLAETQTITNLVGNDLDNFTAKVQASAETFDKDYTEVLVAANSFAKQFGITQSQAIDLINKGFANGADVNGDFLDKVKEYPVQFKQAGFTAEEFIKVASQEPKSGIFGDKLLDTIKEAGLSLREFTKAQEDALKNAFGEKFTKDFKKRIDSGKLTTKDALLAIDEQAKKTGLTVSQQQTLVADLLKGAGEDAGGFAVVLNTVNEALKSNLEPTTELGKKQAENLKIQEAYNLQLIEFSKNFQGLGTTLQSFATQLATNVFSGVNDLIELLKQFYEASVAVTEIIGEAFGVESTKVMTSFTSIVKQSFDFLLDVILLTPKAFIAAGKEILATIGGIANAIKVFGLEIGTFTKSIKDFASGNIGLNDLTKQVSGATQRITESFSFGYDRIKAKFEASKEAAKENTTEIQKNTVATKDNTTATNDNSKAKEKQILNLVELGEKQKEIEKEIENELSKGRKLIRPEFLAAKEKELEAIKKLIERFNFETNFEVSPDGLQLDGEVEKTKEAANQKLEIQKDYYEKDKEIFRQFRLKNEITEKEYQDKLFELEKANIQRQIAEKEKLKQFDVEYYKLKNDLLQLDVDKQKEAFNTVYDNYSNFVNKFVKDNDTKTLLNLLGSIAKNIFEVEQGDKTKNEGILDVLGSFGGFAEGGYTGDGAKYDPAGIVHKGEVVFSQENIKRLGGVKNVENIRNLNFEKVQLTKFYEPISDKLQTKQPIIVQNDPIDIDRLASAIGKNITQFDVKETINQLLITQKSANLTNRIIVKKNRKST